MSFVRKEGKCLNRLVSQHTVELEARRRRLHSPLFPLKLMPSNLWCSITVNPMKPSWLCINQCHMFTERWAALPRDVLKCNL